MPEDRQQGRSRYVRWTEETASGMEDGAVEEWTEVGPDGVVNREIAFDALGNVVHLFPSDKYRRGDYGHFDLAPVRPTGPDSVDPQEFARRWEQARLAAQECCRLEISPQAAAPDPSVTSPLCAAKALRTSSFSGPGTLNASSV